MIKFFTKLKEIAALCLPKLRREPTELPGSEIPSTSPRGPVKLSFKEYLALNMARRYRGRIYYPYTIRQLARLLRRHKARLQMRSVKDKSPNVKAIGRITLMARSRADAVFRCSLPKKQQREMLITYPYANRVDRS